MSDLDELANVGNQRRSPPARTRAAAKSIPTWVIVVGAIVALAIIGQLLRDPAKDQATQSAASAVKSANAEKAAAVRATTDAMVKSGEFYSVDYDSRIVRVDPSRWAGLSLTAKQSVAKCLYLYWEFKGVGMSAEVRSSRSDEVLGMCDSWGQTKIYK